jgi:hypothetical protein
MGRNHSTHEQLRFSGKDEKASLTRAEHIGALTPQATGAGKDRGRLSDMNLRDPRPMATGLCAASPTAQVEGRSKTSVKTSSGLRPRPPDHRGEARLENLSVRLIGRRAALLEISRSLRSGRDRRCRYRAASLPPLQIIRLMSPLERAKLLFKHNCASHTQRRANIHDIKSYTPPPPSGIMLFSKDPWT